MTFFDLISRYVVIPGAVLYFAGWVYLYYFLFALGVSISSANIDVYTVCIYAFSTFVFLLRRPQIYALIALGLVIGVAVLIHRTPPKKRMVLATVMETYAISPLWNFLRSAIGQTAAYAAILVLTYIGSRAAGLEHIRDVENNPGPTVFLQFSRDSVAAASADCKEVNGCYYAALMSANSAGALRKVIDMSDFVVLLDESGNESQKNVFLVPRSLIVFSYVLGN